MMYYSVTDTGILGEKIRVLPSGVEPKTFLCMQVFSRERVANLSFTCNFPAVSGRGILQNAERRTSHFTPPTSVFTISTSLYHLVSSTDYTGGYRQTFNIIGLLWIRRSTFYKYPRGVVSYSKRQRIVKSVVILRRGSYGSPRIPPSPNNVCVGGYSHPEKWENLPSQRLVRSLVLL